MIVTRRHSTKCRRHYSMLLVTNAIHHDQATHLIVRRKHPTLMQRTQTNNFFFLNKYSIICFRFLIDNYRWLPFRATPFSFPHQSLFTTISSTSSSFYFILFLFYCVAHLCRIFDLTNWAYHDLHLLQTLEGWLLNVIVKDY